MAERYSFSVDRHLVPNLSVDGSVVWAQSGIDTTNSSLSDNMNEMYLSAQEDNTEYLSVLDSTGEITSDNLNIRLANPKLEEEDQEEAFTTCENVVEQTSEDGNEQQVVVCTMEGSDELFGNQIAQDEDGNIQKYQFQFRRNDDGQLEAIPETIQILPMDNEEVPEEVTTEVLVQQEENSLDSSLAAQIFVQEDNSDEHILPDNCNEIEEEHEESTVVYENDDIPEEEQNEEDTVDVKPGLLHFHNVKRETKQEQLEECAAEEPDKRPENLAIPCPKCDKTFPNQNSLKIHLHNRQTALQNAQLQIYRYQCNGCGNFFKTSALLMRHACANQYSCEVCRKRCTSLTNLAIHKRSHEKEDLNKSSNTTTDDTPPKRTRGRPEAEASAEAFSLEPAEKRTKNVEIPCPKCDKTFPSQNSLKIHLKQHNQTSLQNAQPQTDKYQCKGCGNSFKNTALLTRHVCAKQYNCEVCKKKYTDLTSLAIHKRSHDKENLLKNTPIPARVLPKTIKTVSPPNLFKTCLKCTTCGKLCSSLAILNAHNKTHKQFFCASCQETFPSNLALKKHIRERCAKAPLSHRRSMRVKSLCSPSTGESSAQPTTASLPSTPLPLTLLEVPTVWDAIRKTKSDL